MAACGRAAFTSCLVLRSAIVPAAETPFLAARAAVLVDPGTRQVLHDLNGAKRKFPASLTKMMTALLVAEHGGLDRTVIVSGRAAAVGETTMNLSAGEKVRLEHLLWGVLLNSANDASVACAEATAGSLEGFVARMNERADELGMKGTHFTNPSGLHHDQHYCTARDLSKLAAEVMGRADLRPIVRLQKAYVPWAGRPYDRELRNRNQLLAQWDQCDGIKTGYTHRAGRCLAASAYRDGWRLICVVLDSKDAWTDARSLLEYGFQRFHQVALLGEGVTRATLTVRGGVVGTVEVTAAESVLVVLPRGEQPEAPRLVDDQCDAPISAGDIVGQLEVRLPDGKRRRVNAVALDSVEQSLWARVLSTPWMLTVMLTAVGLAAGGLLYAAASEALGARRARRPPKV